MAGKRIHKHARVSFAAYLERIFKKLRINLAINRNFYETIRMVPLFFEPQPLAMRWIKRLVWFYVATFVVAKLITVWFGTRCIIDLLCLKPIHLPHGYLWHYVTYSFLHEDFLHIFCNLWLFYILCKFLLIHELTLKPLLSLFFTGIVSGGLFWTLLNFQHPYYSLVGASAGIATLFTYFCLLYPEKTISIFLFFVFPIHIKTLWCFLLFLGYDLINCLFYETQGMSNVAHSAHLGGIFIGFLAFRYVKYREAKPAKARRSTQYRVHIETENVISDVPFGILKKLQSEGLDSLSPEERKWLEQYRKL